MKDEIKEIKINTIGQLLDYVETEEKANELIDHITNLQEENQKLKKARDSYRQEFRISHKDLEMYIRKYECLEEENRQTRLLKERYQLEKEDYKSRNEKANTLLDELLERAYIDGEYIMYDYSTSELLEVKQALQGEDKDE